MRDLERVTGEQPAIEPNGTRKWLMGVFAGAVLLGIGGLIAWGAQGAEVAANCKHLEQHDAQISFGAKERATMKERAAASDARQLMIIDTLTEMKEDIKTLVRRRRR